MTTQAVSAAQAFISEARRICAEVEDPATRWAQVEPLLRRLLADPDLKGQSRDWPVCRHRDDGRAENLLLYEDPDYGFVINGLIKGPGDRTPIHDHAHLWTLYGVLEGSETIDRYERLDDGSKEGYAELRKTRDFVVGPGDVDLVPPWQIHDEANGSERAVAVIVRSGKPGEFLQNRFDPANNRTWQGYGPHQLPWPLL